MGAKIHAIGNAVRDCELSETASGVQVCRKSASTRTTTALRDRRLTFRRLTLSFSLRSRIRKETANREANSNIPRRRVISVVERGTVTIALRESPCRWKHLTQRIFLFDGQKKGRVEMNI